MGFELDWPERDGSAEGSSNLRKSYFARLIIVILLLLDCTLAQNKPRKVFGAGLSKTGTTSLAAALVQLGYSNIHYDGAFIPFLQPSFNFSHCYDHVDSVVDLPTAFYYEDLLREYPNAMFVLTIRDAEEWYRSFYTHNKENVDIYRGVLPKRIVALHDLVFGSAEPDHDLWINHYHRHNDRVRSIIPSNQLLVLPIDDKDAFTKLCGFLNEPCLNFTSNLPIENSRTDRQKKITSFSSWLGTRRTKDELHPSSKHAYASLLPYTVVHDYKAILQGFIVAVRAIRRLGSTNDIIAMVLGKLSKVVTTQLEVLSVRIVYVSPLGITLDEYPDLIDSRTGVIQRSIMRVFELEAYEKVMYFDPRVSFLANCDDLFESKYDFYGQSIGTSPIDVRAFVVRPAWYTIVEIVDVTMAKSFTVTNGWLNYGPINNGRNWDFPGAATSAGLLYYYFVCQGSGSVDLLAEHSWDGKIK